MLHQIGVGALGPVFRTYEPTRDRLVAVKAFRLDIIPEQAQALADELSRAAEAGLFHPSIVEPIAAGVEGTLAYRAEEYVAAESLDVAMRHYAPASFEKALPFITQLAGAIDFARAAGVGHGALHPRDIFVTPEEARATGFGVVGALERVGIRAPVRRPYSAPERIAGADWSTPADVFALAAIAFELLTARRPSGTGAQIGSLAPAGRDAGDHAEAILAVLARAMDDDPNRRYPTALAFASALESAARGQSITDAVATVAAIAAVSPEPAAASTETPARPEPRAAAPESRVRGPESADVSEDIPVPVRDSSRSGGQAGAVRSDALAPEVEPSRTTGEAFLIGAAYGAASEAMRPEQAAPTAPTPGEFTIEERLDPLHAAIEDEMIEEPRRLEFDEPPGEVDVPLASVDEPDRFADDFGDAQLAEADAQRPLEASYETDAEPVPVYTPAEPAYATTGSMYPAEGSDVPERSRPAVLPIAVTLVLGLLAGFAAGYFVGSRDRLPPDETVSESATDAGAPSGPAPTGGARQWSEQSVSGRAPSSTPATPPTEAPAVPDEAAAARPPRTTVPAPRPEPAAARGQLVVRSNPSRANVTVNGRWRGRTPLTLDKLAFGNYAVRVVHDGYEVAREEVPLSAKSPDRTLDVRLQRTGRAASAPPAAKPRSSTPARPPAAASSAPETYTGELFVDSRPQGARVLLDGKVIGRTPLRLAAVPIGSHVVRLELAEHKPWFSTARVTAGEISRVTGSLERLQDQ